MADAGPGSQLTKLIARLDTQIKNEDYKKALKTAEQALVLESSDGDVARCKAVLLLELSRFEDALACIAQYGLDAPLAFEKAYCQYRLGSLQDALASLQGVGSDREEARLQLEAQLQYRLGRYPEAIALYRQLFQQYKVESMEVQTNVLAAYVAGGQSAEVPAVLEAMRASPKDSFEVAFNSACALAEAGELPAAWERLLLAQRAGEEVLMEEGLEEEEIAKELAPITAQLAFVSQRLGEVERAEELYHATLDCGSGDAATEAVAACNLASLALRRGERRAAVEAFRRLESICLERVDGFLRLKPSVGNRLGPSQRNEVLAICATAAIAAARLDVARELLGALGSSPQAPPTLPLLRASLAAAEGRTRDALGALAEAGPGDAAATAARAQLAAGAGDATAALAALASLPPHIAHRRGVLAVALGLLARAGLDARQGATLLAAAGEHWRGGDGARDPQAAVTLGWIQAQLAKRAEQEEVATQVRVAWAVALSDPGNLPVGLAQLAQDLPRLPAGEEEALANASVAVGGGARRRVADGAEADGDLPAKDAAAKQKRPRKRRVRLPKGFDPEHPGRLPDPERWLPKWQRADARKGRKKRRDRDAIKGSQGAGKVDETLDRAAAPAPTEPAKLAPARAQGGGKKKGRGRR